MLQLTHYNSRERRPPTAHSHSNHKVLLLLFLSRVHQHSSLRIRVLSESIAYPSAKGS